METVGENRRRSSEYSIVDGFECVLVRAECYLPFIRAPPEDLTTIYTILLRLVQIAEKLDQSHILATADCAIYSKAQQILWNKPAHLDGKVTMRLAGMHFNMAYIDLTRFNKIATQGAPQMAVDKEANSLSRVYSYYSKFNLRLFYV